MQGKLLRDLVQERPLAALVQAADQGALRVLVVRQLRERLVLFLDIGLDQLDHLRVVVMQPLWDALRQP
eukprot:11017234-Alexandrium_andersonii.AAC.1